MSTQLQPSLPIIDRKPEPYTGPSRDKVLALRHQYLSPGIITYYRDPLMIVEGHMQYVWDETGRRYLDAFAGIVTVASATATGKSSAASAKKRLPATTTTPTSTLPRQAAEKLAEKIFFGLALFHHQRQRSERDRHPLRPRVTGTATSSPATATTAAPPSRWPSPLTAPEIQTNNTTNTTIRILPTAIAAPIFGVPILRPAKCTTSRT